MHPDCLQTPSMWCHNSFPKGDIGYDILLKRATLAKRYEAASKHGGKGTHFLTLSNVVKCNGIPLMHVKKVVDHLR